MILTANRKSIVFFFLFFFISRTSAFSQELYVPDSLVTICPERVAILKKQLEADLKSIHDKKKDEREYIENRFKSRTDYYTLSLQSGDFIINSPFEKYVQDIIGRITKANPILRPNYTIYISRDESPNAFNTGEGNIVVNIGLLDKIDNDAELTFILCHEIAHDFQDHVNRNIFIKAAKYTDKEFQAKLKKTLHERYNTRKRLKEILLPELMSDMRFNRSEETEADSIGLIYYRNTGMDLQQAIETMILLDRIDEFYKDKKIDIKSTLNRPKFAFKDEWLSGSHESSLGSFEEEKDSLEDSLKTHPDTKLRIASIRNQLKRDSLLGGSKFINDSISFAKRKLDAQEEVVYSTFLNENLGRTLYLATILAQEKPNNKFANLILAWGFGRLAYLMKNHEMQTEVSLRKNAFSENYNLYIDFLNEISMADAGKLGYELIQPIDESQKTSEEYYGALIMSSYSAGEKVKAENYHNEYKSHFPKGKYIEHFSSLFITNPKNKK